MKVVIIGATGRTGRYLIEKAVAQGHIVTAFVRSAEKMKWPNSVAIMLGDARNEADLVKALKGQDAVLSAIGSIKINDGLTVRSTEALILAADQTGVKRIIMMSTFLATPSYRPNFIGRLVGGIMKSMVSDKQRGEELLKASDLDWTIVYPTMLDKVKPGGSVRVVQEGELVGMGNAIARIDVADFMVKALASPETIRKAVLITTR